MMSRSQSSLGYLDAGRDDPSAPGVSPSLNQQASSGPINLSGLVCNVRRTTGKEPHPLVGATTTILGDKLYVFGGRILSRSRPQLTADLYELDLVRRHWSKIEATGDIPPPRYFHSVCALGDNKLVAYGGMSPAPGTPRDPMNPNSGESQSEVVVMSDIHIFDVPSRSWTRVAAHESPQGRYAHCATILPSSASFTSASAPLSAIHHNPESTTPHQGSIGVDIDGFGGAEMVVVGGQDSSNHYIEQISVFNLRSLKWTNTSPLGRSCGAYRSVVAPLVGMDVSEIGSAAPDRETHEPIEETAADEHGCPMLIYSNYNFLDVKLELQVRLPDGRLVERPMQSQASPPGLRFPNGGIINGHFVVSGTYLTSSKQEYALWALDLKTLTWGRIDAGGSVFGQGSWNRGILWPRRSTFVILGHRKRSLVDDYNHRRINFSHVCMVELEAFGLYNNPSRTAPTSGYKSYSSPSVPASLQQKLAQLTTSRPLSAASDELGKLALSLHEMSDMELQAVGGERIPVNSRLLARRWGPYFIQLLRESSEGGIADGATLRPAQVHPSRNSSITITPSIGQNSSYSNATTLVNPSVPSKALLENLEVPSAHGLAPTSRPRVLYLPHTILTLQVLVQYLYTSAIPPPGSSLCTPQILCSLLQLARPYQVNGLLEATVERLHQVLDGRNAAAVFNAAAMAAGGGRGTGFTNGLGGTLEALNGSQMGRNGSIAVSETTNSQHSILHASDSSDTEHGAISNSSSTNDLTNFARGIPSLRIDTNLSQQRSRSRNHRDREDSISNASTATSASSASYSQSDSEFISDSESRSASRSHHRRDTDIRPGREIWTGDLSSVIGLQKRGLRGLMEGRRMRERSVKPPSASSGSTSVPASAGSGDHHSLPMQGVAG
ncbi:hypothetical protein N7532_009445 [Penicillium argentinense]|uniref:Regulatory protein Ral2 n=1 Tax=Penicillium argentinense TaxID=1131581 RepID=A0A9W9EZG5_9EURO|nr:uncharacterized protein N7532_009445 [Penicillium argentinense]KAJ5090761.1 hypothetical protein N7532_009445 [Penicillium argentinense]